MDLTADLFGKTTIDRCRETVKVRLKRNKVQYVNPDHATKGHEAQRREYGSYETLYFGSPKSKDFVRIYDKSAQLRAKKVEPATIPLAWVRFERSFTGDGVPAKLATLGALLKNGADYDPFSSIEILPNFDLTSETIYEWDGPLNQRMKAEWALTLIKQHGLAEATRKIRAEGRNPKQIFKLLETVMSEVAHPVLSTAELTARYQYSFASQLFGVEPSRTDPHEPELTTGAITIHASGSKSQQTL